MRLCGLGLPQEGVDALAYPWRGEAGAGACAGPGLGIGIEGCWWRCRAAHWLGR